MKKVIYVIAGFIVLNIITTIIGVSVFFSKFVPNIPEANYPVPEHVQESRAQDRDYFRQFTSIDNSFSSEEED